MVLLTGRWVSTLPFLQRDIIDGDVSLDAWSPDTFEYHLQREKTCLSDYMFSLGRPQKNKKISTAFKGSTQCNLAKLHLMKNNCRWQVFDSVFNLTKIVQLKL